MHNLQLLKHWKQCLKPTVMFNLITNGWNALFVWHITPLHWNSYAPQYKAIESTIQNFLCDILLERRELLASISIEMFRSYFSIRMYIMSFSDHWNLRWIVLHSKIWVWREGTTASSDPMAVWSTDSNGYMWHFKSKSGTNISNFKVQKQYLYKRVLRALKYD